MIVTFDKQFMGNNITHSMESSGDIAVIYKATLTRIPKTPQSSSRIVSKSPCRRKVHGPWISRLGRVACAADELEKHARKRKLETKKC